MDQPGKVANPARGQLNRENNIPLSPCVPENLVSRDGFSRPVPRQPAHLHPQAESGAYLRDSSRVPRRRPFMKPPYAIGSVPSLSGHAIAYRWRSLPRVRRHRASKPQGSSERVLPWQITMDRLIFIILSRERIKYMILHEVCYPIMIFFGVILYVWCSSPVFSLSPDEYLVTSTSTTFVSGRLSTSSVSFPHAPPTNNTFFISSLQDS